MKKMCIEMTGRVILNLRQLTEFQLNLTSGVRRKRGR